MLGLFTGRKYLLTGVLNDESIAWHVAAALQAEGAEVVLTSFGRALRITAKAAGLLPRPAEVLELDVTDDAGFSRIADEVSRWDRLDGVLHSVAYAPADALGKGFLTTPAASALEGFRASAFSLQQLACALAPALARAEHGGSVVGMTVDTGRALPGYDWMGVFKTALASIAQYLALYLGSSGVRVNLVAAGPVETVSARGVSSFNDLADYYERWAPLGWDRNDPSRVIGAVLFLLSDLSRYTTGQVLHADGGMHAVVGGVGAAPAVGDPAVGDPAVADPAVAGPAVAGPGLAGPE
ncbi:MAG: SDR family oxidoreductase [Jatrophihabitantaceae bacterium]